MIRYRNYVFAVAFLRRKSPQFLILHRTKNWRGWEIVKGGLKDGEDELVGLRREICEETGAKKFKIIAKTKHAIRYSFSKGFLKDNHIFYGARGNLFLVELLSKRVRIDRREHDTYKWVSKEDALKLLTHKNHKNALVYVCQRYKLC
jgi:8-oxo-dGTP pyrophosphatase MutT (NUDIX family)